MLTIKNLKSGYGNVEILHNVDLEVRPGEIVAVIGFNGSGKSTLLNSIFRLADIHSGSIYSKEKDLTSLKTYELIESGINFVPQGRQIFSNMSVIDNLQMGA